MRKYILEMNEDQAQILTDALEFYARMSIGQWKELADISLDMRDDEYFEKREALVNGLKKLRAIAYPELPYDGSYSVTAKPLACLAWELYTVMRHRIAWTNHPEGGIIVDFDDPISFSGIPLAECNAVERQGKEGEED